MREYVWLERKPLEHLWKRCVFASFGICAVFEVEKENHLALEVILHFRSCRCFHMSFEMFQLNAKFDHVCMSAGSRVDIQRFDL